MAMEEAYQLEMLLNNRNLEFFKLQKQLETLMQDYNILKKHVEDHALNEVRKANTDVRRRWQYYHDHKNTIKAESGLQNWREIKKLSDQRYYQESQE